MTVRQFEAKFAKISLRKFRLATELYDRNGEEINGDSIDDQNLSLIKAGNDEFGGPNDSFSNAE